MPVETNAILIHYGEIALKGKNQPLFLRRLKSNLKQRLRSLGAEWPVRLFTGYCFVELPPQPEQSLLDRVLTALGEVAGVVWYAPAHRLPAETVRLLSEAPDYDLMAAHLVALARARYTPNSSFCVRVKRAEKRFPLTSPELEAALGAAVIRETGWSQVDLEEPAQTFYVDIQTEGVDIYASKWRGIGGLPVGVSGRVLTLLSGGIDSPVAAYLMAKRGCPVDFIHFTATPLRQSRAPAYKVSQMVQKLSNFTLYSRLCLVPYTHFELAMLGEQAEYELIIFRRFMARVAEQLAYRQKAQALVTGDSLGQVASQTIENLVSNSQAVTLPILRPLLTFDKDEIVDLARRISTYRLSLQPYKDCCSILASHPITKSKHRIVSHREERVLADYEELIRRTLDDAIYLTYECGELVG